MENKYILIKEIAEDFVFQTYNNEIPDGYSFSLCYPLSILFSLMEIEHEISIGKSRKNNIEVSHFWITFDNNGIILDPTIKQFNQNESSVYLGDIQKNETTNRYIKIENKGDEIFPNIYELWANLLYQHKHRIPLPIELEKKLITLNVAASQVLFYYINKLGLKEMLLKSKYGLSYFKPISFVFNQHNLVDEILICLNQTSLKYKDEIIELGKIA
jgi:hypothetical protein